MRFHLSSPQLFPTLPRRTWLVQQAQTALFMATAPVISRRNWGRGGLSALGVSVSGGRTDSPNASSSPEQRDALVNRAVEAAHAAGARYADARLTRTVEHFYDLYAPGRLQIETEEVGLGVRVLVDGYWGFAATSYATLDEAARLAQAAVIQAQTNAKGPPRTVELGQLSPVTGQWSTPVTLDAFAIPIEEKLDHIRSWHAMAAANGIKFVLDGGGQYLRFLRQERVLATSVGTLVTQTVYETAGTAILQLSRSDTLELTGLDAVGRGWEAILDADVPHQITHAREVYARTHQLPRKPAVPKRVTLVCDGATMASLLEGTLGVATQLDRAFGYEANASGTSYLDDPLAMVGQLAVAAPCVTVTANRSAPTELATVQWDDEGVTPELFPLVKDGVLVDFQTTREQAGWLAPYYQRRGRPVRSHGCAGVQNALYCPLQMTPNLALAPASHAIGLDDLVTDVTNGVLVHNGRIAQSDFQGRTGILKGEFVEIRNGRVTRSLDGGAVFFNSAELWKHTTTVGGSATEMVKGFLGGTFGGDNVGRVKGEPGQSTSHSVRAVAALIPNQPLIID